ncbi:iron uptake system protein EfeO [Bosea sp. BK604]|uniref:iron uptake system protein EfeO n=1 Tax=Bosea sp. BK604 TaxID=2512180 RepID=UPI00104A6760|nr:iron uptake system protein EfeO [Bosea sp. BK604]TCR62259.1 iron uptake system component EfeO [Bosea sp. BK604]
MAQRFAWLAGASMLAAVIASPALAVSPLELVTPIADYKLYVSRGVDTLVRDTRAFTDAVKAGDLAKAQALYAPTRVSYEMIEPIAELFSDLDGSIDSRADDHEKKEEDPEFTGFHRIEYGLFAKKSTEGLTPFADKLMSDVTDLQARIKGLTIPPDKMIGGAAALIEEVAATKISGEEDRYSHTDLWDFQANIDGARKIVDLLRPLTERTDKAYSTKIDANFAAVEKTLAKYRVQGGGFETYDKLTEADRKTLAAAITTLAEDLAKLQGLLGLS